MKIVCIQLKYLLVLQDAIKWNRPKLQTFYVFFVQVNYLNLMQIFHVVYWGHKSTGPNLQVPWLCLGEKLPFTVSRSLSVYDQQSI